MEEKIDYESENLKKRDLIDETVLWDFLQFLKEKKYIDDWTFEFEKEISLFLYGDILDKHYLLIQQDLHQCIKDKLGSVDDELFVSIINVINGKYAT